MTGARGPDRPGVGVALAVLCTVVLWASAFPGIRAGLTGYSPTHLVALRYAVSAVALALIAPLAGVRVPARRDALRLAVLGGVGISAYNVALSLGQTHVSAGAASLLVNTGPLFTALLAHLFLGERLRGLGWAGLAVSFTGAVVIAFGSGDDLGLDPWTLLVLLAALFQAVSFVVQKPLYQAYRPLEIAAYMIWAGAALNLVLAPGLVDAVRGAPMEATLSVVYLGVFPAAVAYVAWSYVLGRMPASQAGSYLYSVPVFAFVIAWVWLGEVPDVATVIGGALALLGVGVVNVSTRG